MARRVVTHVRKSNDGLVILLCNPMEWWSPVTAIDVAMQLTSGRHTYVTVAPDRTTARIRVDAAGALTAAARDGSNHFDELPAC